MVDVDQRTHGCRYEIYRGVYLYAIVYVNNPLFTFVSIIRTAFNQTKENDINKLHPNARNQNEMKFTKQFKMSDKKC